MEEKLRVAASKNTYAINGGYEITDNDDMYLAHGKKDPNILREFEIEHEKMENLV